MENIELKNRFEEYDRQVDEIVKNTNKNMVVLAKLLYEIKKEELWRAGGYKSFSEYVESKKELAKSYASELVRTYELGLMEEIEKENLSWHKIHIILPALKENPQKKDEIIELAKTTSLKELKKEILLYRKEKVKTEKASLTITGTLEEIQFIQKSLSDLAKIEGKTEIEVLIEILREFCGRNGNNEILKDIHKKSRQFSDMFISKFERYFGSRYMFQGVKDKLLCDRLVKHFSLEELEKAMDVFFTLTPQDGRWWNSWTIGVFYKVINDLIVKTKQKSEREKIREKYRKVMEEN